MTKTLEGISAVQLQMFVDKLERLDEAKSDATKDLSDGYSEAQSAGFDKKVIRQVLKLRKMDKDKADEYATLVDLYKTALGM